MTNVSIIIPFFNNIRMTKACLESIYRKTFSPGVHYEIILVDDASRTPYSFAEHKRKFGSSFRLIKNKTNLGFAKSCNRGAAVADGEYLVFLNNDIIALEGWLEGLLSAVQFNSEVGIVGSKLLYPDKTIQHAGVCFDDEHLPFHIYHRLPSAFPGANKRREFNAVTGACFLIPAVLFREIGGFDENYINGLEDIDLCLKVRAIGKKVVYSPASVLYHLESKTRSKVPAKQVDNLAYFKKLWEKRIQPDYLKYYKEDFTENRLPDLFVKIKRILEQNGVLAIWGAGRGGRHILSLLEFIQMKPHVFIDSDPQKWGGKIREYPICPPEYLIQRKKQEKEIFVFISSLWSREIKKALIEMGFTADCFY